MKTDKNQWKQFPYAPICFRMHSYGAICRNLYQKHMIQLVSCCKSGENTEIAQMTFLPMGYMHDFNVNTIAHSKSSQIPYVIIKYAKKKSATKAEPVYLVILNGLVFCIADRSKDGATSHIWYQAWKEILHDNNGHVIHSLRLWCMPGLAFNLAFTKTTQPMYKDAHQPSEQAYKLSIFNYKLPVSTQSSLVSYSIYSA